MTHRHDGEAASEEERRSLESELDEVRERSLFKLIPRRDLTKAALLVVLLVVVVALQRRSGAIIRSLTRGLSGPAPAQTGTSNLEPSKGSRPPAMDPAGQGPSGSRATEPPRVRVAPPPP